MKSVLISVRPEWCELIVGGKKTIEVRKTRPKIETPFKCYLFCTTGHPYISVQDGRLDREHYRTNTVGRCNGKVIGEFVCDKIVAVLAHPTIFAGHPMFFEKACKDACLSYDEIEKYAGDKDAYGWHISDLKIYDKPREISEFCTGRSRFILGANGRLGYTGMTRPPQSWCYVEELEGK